MKKIISILMIVIMNLGLTACNNTYNSNMEGNEAFQFAFDASAISKEYALELLNDRLISEGIEDVEILDSPYGFVTSETPQTIVAFRYTYGGETDIYGYKFNVDFDKLAELTENETFEFEEVLSIEDESVEIAEVLLSE